MEAISRMTVCLPASSSRNRQVQRGPACSVHLPLASALCNTWWRPSWLQACPTSGPQEPQRRAPSRKKEAFTASPASASAPLRWVRVGASVVLSAGALFILSDDSGKRSLEVWVREQI